MKNKIKFIFLDFVAPALLIGAFIFSISSAFTGCATSSGTTTTTAAKIQSALSTAANVLQQFNTGLQTAAPTIDALLAATHNQGDAEAVNNVATQSAAFTPALQALLATVQAAISASQSPAAQQAAVNAALSPASVAAIVAPISAATSN